MKKPLLVYLFSLTVAWATETKPYDKETPAKISLPLAYEQAMIALAPNTNAFHCFSANLGTDCGPEGEWQFVFYSTNSPPLHKWVTVEFNGEIHVEEVRNR